MPRRRWHAVAVAVLLSAAVAVVVATSPALRGAVLRATSLAGDPDASPRPSAPSGGSGVPGPLGCPVSEKLVPRCGVWWGAAPGVFSGVGARQALADFEAKTNRRVTVYHRYHRGDTLFPTGQEIAAARDPDGGRVLFVNWKAAWGGTWADVAAGRMDERIDRLAAHINGAFPERFFLAIHHEPENEVDTDPASGMTADDYASMYRHTVQRLRMRGVDNAVFVMTYMGYERWGVQPWFPDLYPGDSVVDWIGVDSYVSANPDAHHYGDFARLVNLTSDRDRWPGFYDWAVENHPGKPLMLAEWGVFEHRADAGRKAWIFATARRQLAHFPAIKASVYFDSPAAPRGDTSVDSSDQALDAFRALASLPEFSTPIRAGATVGCAATASPGAESSSGGSESRLPSHSGHQGTLQ